MRIRLPNNWQPRPYQLRLWSYLERGGKRAIEIAHRRWGKDEVCLHWGAVASHMRPATYWHMLPLATQARKAIWEAVNPHTGIRRIDEAFPKALRETTREQEMMIRFKNGSTWQVVGSDNYNALVGSPPAGVVFSEFALNNPASWSYLRPILAENGGWALFITTPRGKNHAHKLYESARRTPGWFAELQSADDTGVFSDELLERERQEQIDLYGEDAGNALFEQEYHCSFEAAILGAFYGKEMGACRSSGRITKVSYDPDFPVFTAWDLGYTDDTAIWFWQVIAGEVRVIDYHYSHGHDVPFYADLIKRKGYEYAKHWLPHDARAKTLASGGKSVQEQLAESVGWGKLAIVPSLSVQDGIQAARQVLKRCWFDEDACFDGIEALTQYRREFDQDRRMFRDSALHDWTSHGADAFRMLAIAWREPYKDDRKAEPKYFEQMTADDLFWGESKSNFSGIRRI